MRHALLVVAALATVLACQNRPPPATPPARAASPATVYLTSAAGDAMTESRVDPGDGDAPVRITVHLDRERQTFYGVGGSLTQASAAALATIRPEQRAAILEAYFGPDGAAYALSRTHIASSDFSTESYLYVSEEPDPELESFSIQADRDNGLLALIQDARAVPGADFRIVASPWSAPPWMKDNGRLYDPESRRGGRLLREHYGTFARYFVRYLEAYRDEGIPIWAISPVNEPGGNSGNWESMEMSPEEQRDFIRVLGPTLREAGFDTRVLIFDQNRLEMAEFTETIFNDPEAAPYAFGTAVHWYNSTYRVYEDVLDAQHALYPDRVIIHTEGTIDSIAADASCAQQCSAGPPCGCEEMFAWWQNDGWYWEREATDWGWDWAENREEDHPRYAPAFRYARDLVVGMAHWLAGWIDWNIVLDKRGGPNHVDNWCLAPVMVDGETDAVYYAPTFHILRQVSRNSRPGGVVLQATIDGGPEGLHAAAIRNPDGSIAVHVFDEGEADVPYVLEVGDATYAITSPAASLQTVVIGGRGD
jgi:glucosylceramidase